MNDKDDIRSDSLCWGSTRDYHHHRIHKISLLQLVLFIVAERVLRRVLDIREGGLSASGPSVCPHTSIIYHSIYRISIRRPLYLDNTQRKHCCLSVAMRHEVTIQDTTVCWRANIQGIVTVELTSATDWRLSCTISPQLRSCVLLYISQLDDMPRPLPL